MTTDFGCVVLTQGNRPDMLRQAVGSLLAQTGVELDVVVVGNGWAPEGLPAGVSGVALPVNVGIPAGRNAGIPHVTGELLFFLDDDACLPEPDTLSRLGALLAADPALGIVQLRVVDPAGTKAPRRHVPRLRTGDPCRSSDVTTFWEGAVGARRRVFVVVGGFPASFFYAHEGIDMAWRAMDAGFRVHYAGDLVAHHPVMAPTRHVLYAYLSARNRVWLARRHLPVPFAVAYIATWGVLTAARLRDLRSARDTIRGFADGFRQPAGPRRPLGWSTIWRMTRLGRPPVI